VFVLAETTAKITQAVGWYPCTDHAKEKECAF